MTQTDVAVKIAEHDEKITVINHRIKDLETKQDVIQELALSVNELAINMRSMVKEQERQGTRISALEQQPAKHWNTIVTVVITAITSGVITYVISQIVK